MPCHLLESGPAPLAETDARVLRTLEPSSTLKRSERSIAMGVLIAVVVIVVLLALLGFGFSVRIVKQYERGVLFRLGRLRGSREPGFQLIIPVIDVLHRVSLRIVTLPIQSQGIITRDNVSVDVSAVAYYRVVDAVKSVVAIENVRDAIDQIAQTTLRKVVGQQVPAAMIHITVSPNCTTTQRHIELFQPAWRFRRSARRIADSARRAAASAPWAVTCICA